jgi:beta-N-acetylhexosaminidase
MTVDSSLTRLAEGILVPPFPGTTVPDWLMSALDRGLAGVTLFGMNVSDPAQVAALTTRLRTATDEPIIAIDEEGGDVTRIAHMTGSPYPGNAALGAVDDTGLTTEIYRALGSDLAAVGINVDLAPSVDVNTAADNPIIGTRSFGADTALVARHAAAAVTGLQSAGVAACAKHFPGHGSTRSDSHHVIASVDGGVDELRRRDLPPFAAAIAAGVRAVMPGHLRVPGLTGELPATWSAAAITGLLRGELGFTGVIITDALEMRAVSAPHGVPEAAVRTVAAGVDLVCLGRDQDEEVYLAVRAAITDAVTDGRLPAGRLEDAGRRVAELRGWLAGWRASGAAEPDGAEPDGAEPGSAEPGSAESDRAEPGRAEPDSARSRHDVRAGLAAARRALRVFGLSRPLADPVVVELRPQRNIAVGSVPWGLGPWLHDGVYQIDTGPGEADRVGAIEDALAKAAGRPLVVVVRDAHRHPAARAITTALLAARPDAVVVEMGLPVWRPASGGYVATYGAARPNGQAAAEALGLAAAQPT